MLVCQILIIIGRILINENKSERKVVIWRCRSFGNSPNENVAFTKLQMEKKTWKNTLFVDPMKRQLLNVQTSTK